MKIIAKSKAGAEYLYKAESAHAVSERSAETILRVLNENKWNLRDGEIWHIHDVDSYDNAYYYAQGQKFTIRKGIVKRVYY